MIGKENKNAEIILYTKSYINSNKQKEFGTIALVYRGKKTAVEWTTGKSHKTN